MPNVRHLIYLLSLGLTLIACDFRDTTGQTCQPPHCLIYGLTQSVTGIDPHIHNNTELGIIARNVYDTLVYRHPQTGNFVSGLATRWDISPDRTVYTFTLRQNVTFHDGTPFNAEAVATNFARIFSDETASQHARFLLGPIATYQVIDPYTFRITLQQAYEPLLDALSQVYLGIASPQALTQFTGDQLRYQYHQVGTGAFRFVEYVPEDRIVIQRNPTYDWQPDFYGEIGTVQRIEFRFFRDADQRARALTAGAVHIIGDLSPSDARLLNAESDITLLPIDIPGQPLQFYMNTQSAPTDELAVRQALIYAINRTAIVDAIYGGFSSVAWGPIAASTEFYNRGVVNVYDYNLTQARSLLAQMNYRDSDGDNILDREGIPLSITLIQSPNALLPEVVAFLRDQWQSLGIQVIVKQVPGNQALRAAALTGDYNLIPFHQSGIDPVILNQAYLSTGANNWTNYTNVELDSALLQATQLADREQRRLAYGGIQATILEQALILPIRDQVLLNATRNSVSGLRYDPYGWYPLLYSVSIDP